MSIIIDHFLVKKDTQDDFCHVNTSGQGVENQKHSQEVREILWKETISHFTRTLLRQRKKR